MEHTALVELITAIPDSLSVQIHEKLTNDAPLSKASRTDLRLWSAIRDAGKEGGIRKETIFEHLFPGEEYQEGKLKKAMAHLHRHLQSVLLQFQYNDEDNAFHQGLDLASAYRKLNLFDRAYREAEKLKTAEEDNALKNQEHFFRLYKVNLFMHDLESRQNRQKSDVNILPTLQSLDLFYHLQRFYLLNRFLLQQKVAQIDFPPYIVETLREDLMPNRYMEVSAELVVNHKIFQLLTATEHSAVQFEQLSALIRENEHQLDFETRRFFHIYLRNICVLAINRGHHDLLPVLHELQQESLEKGFLYYNNGEGLSSSGFISLTATALRIGRVDWAEQFIESHKNRIIGDNETQDCYRLGKACLLFEKGQLDDALDCVPAASPFLDYHLIARRLELKIYYEQQSDLLSYKLNSFKMFISRSSQKFLPDGLRIANGDFANLLLQIIQCPPGDKDRAQKVTRRILEKPEIAEREWLLAKAALLR